MKQNTTDLISFIVCYSSERDIDLTTVRLVKFVYLADLFSARYNNGATLTNFPWRFVHYGPYCTEVMGAIDSVETTGLISSKSFESKYTEGDYKIYFCEGSDSYSFSKTLPDDVVSQLKRVIKKFGDDTPALLDFVYFDTEPMEGVVKGDLLNFSKARLPIISKENPARKLTKEEIENGRKCIQALADKLMVGRNNLAREDREMGGFKDLTYYETIECLDGDDLQAGLSGTALLKLA